MNDKLIRAAAEARKNAYAPYSKFPVGAAVLTSSNRIFTGCNIENVSFGLTICAERVAIANAVAAGEQEIEAIAVVADGTPSSPCGACLQVIQEFASGKSLTIISANTSGSVIVRLLSDYMPYGFTDFKPDGDL
ncbi:MAG: cytidine deaminase [Armatimonadota bacterium]